VHVLQINEQIGVELKTLRPEKETDAATCESLLMNEMFIECGGQQFEKFLLLLIFTSFGGLSKLKSRFLGTSV
jgi:hypothetical protein